MTTRLILVRHAHSAPSPELPERDWPLSDKGHAQAEALAPVLAELGVTALVSSPLVRAVATLRPFAAAAALPIALDEDLRERNLAAGWLPDPADAEAAIDRMHADLDYRLPGGESGRETIARFEAALARVALAHRGHTVAVGSHGGVIGHLLRRHRPELAEGFWRAIRNPHLFLFEVEERHLWIGERTFDGTPGVANW